MRLSLICLVLTASVLRAAENPAKKASTHVEVMLNAISAEKNKIGALTAAVAVTPGRTLLVEDADRFYEVAWGGVRRVEGIKGLSAFSYSSDGVFMGIRDKELVYLSKNGPLEKIIALPSAGMGLAAGRGKMYLYERNGGDKNGLYILFPGKKSLRLFDSPEPIDAVLEAGDRVLFSAGNAIFEFSADKKTNLLVEMPKGSRVISLALDPKTLKVYASDGASVFSFGDKHVNVITKESGGVLRWFGTGLIIFDPKVPLLVRIVGLP